MEYIDYLNDLIKEIYLFEISSDIFFNMAVALACGIFIFIIFYIINKKISVNRSFSYTLILLPVISAMVSIIVSNDIVLVAGMLGALSIIRFRHSMKESKNLVFVFWAVTAGIASGLSFTRLSIIWCIIVGSVTLIIHFLSNFRTYGMLTVKTGGSIQDIENVFNSLSIKFSLKYKSTETASDIIYEIKRNKGLKESVSSALCDKIMQLDGVSAVKYIEMR